MALQHRRIWVFLNFGSFSMGIFSKRFVSCQLSHTSSGPSTSYDTTLGDGTISPADPFQTVGECFAGTLVGQQRMTTQPPSSTHMARSRLNRQIRGLETTIFLLHGVSRTRAQKKHAALGACFPFFFSIFFFHYFLLSPFGQRDSGMGYTKSGNWTGKRTDSHIDF